MSKIKDLKNDTNNIVNYAELLQNLFPDIKTKYLELLIKITKDKILNNSFYSDVLNERISLKDNVKTRIKYEEYNTLDGFSLYLLFSQILDNETMDMFLKFVDFNEKNQIENNDVTAIENFNTIENEVSKVELRQVSKEMETQIIKLYEDTEWLVIKPLTVLSSRKYGAHTKWCTTSKDYTYFHNYATDGILIYILNKKNGYKVALHKYLDFKRRGEVTFWDAEDRRIDSMEANLPTSIFQILANEVKNCKKSNRNLLSSEEKIKENKTFPYRSEEKMAGEVIRRENPIRIRDAEERGGELVNFEDNGNDMAMADEPINDRPIDEDWGNNEIGIMARNENAYNGDEPNAEEMSGNFFIEHRFDGEGVNENETMDIGIKELTIPRKKYKLEEPILSPQENAPDFIGGRKYPQDEH